MTQDGLWAAIAADVSCARAATVQRQIRPTKVAHAMQRCGDVMMRAVNRSFLGYDDQDDKPSRRAPRRLDQCRGLLHDRPRRAVSLCQKRLDLGRRERLDLQLRLVRVGAKFTIGERASKARRNAATRSAGTPGGAANGRPASWRIRISSSTCLLSTSATRSSALGTSGNSGSFVRPIWTMTLRSLPVIQ